MSNKYYDNVKTTKGELEQISPTMCLAKWYQVSLHLPQGLTQSCYHPPTHLIPVIQLDDDPSVLHNTQEKINQRKQMLAGDRPAGCQYCWNIEDAPNGPHYSDRHYRSSEWWVEGKMQDAVLETETAIPRYVEVNFNQACNFKCVYCSPHLSTAWESEIQEHGPVPVNNGFHNDIESLNKKGLMPLKVSNNENPYVQAFWRWWPKLYKALKVFRMTGGEPLMDKNTFKVLDYVDENPNSSLDLSITSNMCPPNQELFDKFIAKLKKIEEVRIWEDKERINPETNNNWYVAPACKHFSLFVSVDTVGEHAEYVREGLNFDKMLKNVKTVLSETHGTEITFINTFNLMSVPRLKDFLKMILDLRQEFGYTNQKEIEILPPSQGKLKHPPFIRKRRQRIWFDIPYLRFPNWIAVENIIGYPEYAKILDDCLEFMIEHKEDENYSTTLLGFKEYEIDKLKRNIEHIKHSYSNMSVDELNDRKKTFKMYFDNLDIRRNKNFLKTFPELRAWYNDCSQT